MKVVTGGAGFIGSWVLKKLFEKEDRVLVVDNFSTGRKENIEPYFSEGKIDLIKQDIAEMGPDAFRDVDTVFHLAADPNVKTSAEKPEEVYSTNLHGTYRVLEACRKNDVKKLLFASTSAVYGVSDVFPIPETAELKPISNYGATKAASEMLIRGYAETYGIDASIVRLANIFGPPSKKGVMHDFVRKLQKNPERLLILGNGLQQKSYLWVEDAVDAMFSVIEHTRGVEVFNVGSPEWITVREIADIISSEMGLSPEYEFTVPEGDAAPGWKGDVPKFLLDISKIESLGWEPKTGLRDGISMYVSWLVSESRRP